METDTKQEDVATPAPAAKEVAEQTMEQLQARVKDYETELATVKKERADNTRASQKWQQRAERIDTLEAGQKKLEAMIAGLAQTTFPDDETRQVYEKHVKDAEPKLNLLDAGYGTALDVYLEDEGVSLEDLSEEEMAAAKALYQKDMKAGARAVKKVIDKHKAGLTAKRKAAEEEDNSERQKKAAALSTPRVSSQGRGHDKWTLAEIEQMGHTPEGMAEYAKHEREIKEAMWRGDIK